MLFHQNRTDKILLTGVCYVHALLRLRYEKHSVINAVHPHFNISEIDFFKESVSDKFLFTDFHGQFSSVETEADNLYDLLQFYQDKCKLMYVVGATHINTSDVGKILTKKDFKKLSAFWYFLFDESWNPLKVKEWSNQRDKAILRLLADFPNLKFILYQTSCMKWWKAVGLPRNRYLKWHIDWGMSHEDFEEIRQSFINNRKGISHRFPVESSYNELCDMILADYEHNLF